VLSSSGLAISGILTGKSKKNIYFPAVASHVFFLVVYAHEALVERKHIQISTCSDPLYSHWKQWVPPDPKQHLNIFLFIIGKHIAISLLALLYKLNTKRYTCSKLTI
jgi:hypothetical protein